MSKWLPLRNPLLIFREGTHISHKKEARTTNILTARIISECLRRALGPKGMSKLLVDKFGEMAVTNDGAIILDKMDIHHPIVKILREAAKTVERIVGDGTKTMIVVVGELLKKAEDLMGNKLHVSTIIQGYGMAYEIALKTLGRVSKPLKFKDRELLKKIATAMLSTKNLGTATEHLANLVVEAIHAVAERRDGKIIVNKEDIQITKKLGRCLLESELIRGIIINRKVVHGNMPRSIRDARIAVLDMALKIDEFRHLQPFKREIMIQEVLALRSS